MWIVRYLNEYILLLLAGRYVYVKLNPQKHLITYDYNTAWTLC